MNPLNLSPAALAFWSSVIRHVLTGLGGVLVAHGYVTKTGSDLYIEELIGVVFYGAGQIWSSRRVIWDRAKMLTALWMPRGTTEAAVDAHIARGLPTPAITTPPDTVPGIPSPKEQHA